MARHQLKLSFIMDKINGKPLEKEGVRYTGKEIGKRKKNIVKDNS